MRMSTGVLRASPNPLGRRSASPPGLVGFSNGRPACDATESEYNRGVAVFQAGYTMKSGIRLLWVILSTVPAILPAAQRHNLILFVPDGLRSQIVTDATAPAMAQLRSRGVDFHNSHSLFPTFTTANASAFATGHRL